MFPEPSMGTMSCDADPLLPSRHPWSSGSMVERERWERVDSGFQSYTLEVIYKRPTSLNPCASNSHPPHDPPFPSCTWQAISGDASVTVSAECSALAPSSASFLSSTLSNQLASCYFTKVRVGFCSCINDPKMFMLIPVPLSWNFCAVSFLMPEQIGTASHGKILLEAAGLRTDLSVKTVS